MRVAQHMSLRTRSELLSVKTRLPTNRDIDALTAFLPRLYAEGFSPIDRWLGTETEEDGMIRLGWPVYNKTVKDFVRVASRKCWCVYEYDPTEAEQMLADEAFVRSASLAQIKTMLTYCIRAEHLGPGAWAWVIEQGRVRRLLERLVVLQAGNARGNWAIGVTG